MAELHVCDCSHVANDDPTKRVDGCAAVPFRDVCRFEQALADPVDAQVRAAGVALMAGVVAMVKHVNATGDVESITHELIETLARETLAAAAIVVLGRPPCTSCGRPLGTGTLLDHSPTMPRGESLMGGEVVTVPGMEASEWFLLADRDSWPEFAGRYRCPACAEAQP